MTADNNGFHKHKTVRSLAVGVATYSGFSILGPLLIFLPIGLILDNVFKTKPLMIFIGVFIAFVVTNILLFKKIRQMIKDFDEEANKIKDE